MSKGWVISVDGLEYCSLVHAETRAGAFKEAVAQFECEWIEVRARRLPGLDDKPINYENTKAAGFRYIELSGEGDYDEDDDVCYEKKEHFSNYCVCDICREESK